MNSDFENQCRICFEREEKAESLIMPCRCKGSIKEVHENCLNLWFLNAPSSKKHCCEICGYIYRKSWSVKPLYQWSFPVIRMSFRKWYFVFADFLGIFSLYIARQRWISGNKLLGIFHLGMSFVYGVLFVVRGEECNPNYKFMGEQIASSFFKKRIQNYIVEERK